MRKLILKLHYVFDVPFAIFAILSSDLIQPAYRMGFVRRMILGLRMFYNSLRVKTGTSYKTHLAMALKLFEMSPDVRGDVVECGTWKGGSAANLSLVCRIVGRRLRIFDSFEGLPVGVEGDREAKHYRRGDYCGPLDEVRANIARYGAPEVCEFVKGWFEATLSSLEGPIVLAFVDVDLEASLDTCVRSIWPHLTESGCFFVDEAVSLDYVSLFYSESWWRRNFDRNPPGLMGAGIGLALGDYFVGPYAELATHPLWRPNGVGYTQKNWSAVWTYDAVPK